MWPPLQKTQGCATLRPIMNRRFRSFKALPCALLLLCFVPKFCRAGDCPRYQLDFLDNVVEGYSSPSVSAEEREAIRPLADWSALYVISLSLIMP